MTLEEVATEAQLYFEQLNRTFGTGPTPFGAVTRGFVNVDRTLELQFTNITGAIFTPTPENLSWKAKQAYAIALEAGNKVRKDDRGAAPYYLSAYSILNGIRQTRPPQTTIPGVPVTLPPESGLLPGTPGLPGSGLFPPTPTPGPTPGPAKIFGIPQNLVIAGAALLLLPRLLKL
jgi:hypothetical protein